MAKFRVFDGYAPIILKALGDTGPYAPAACYNHKRQNRYGSRANQSPPKLSASLSDKLFSITN